MSQQHQRKVCLCERAISALMTMFSKIFAKRLFGITKVDHIISHHIQIVTITFASINMLFNTHTHVKLANSWPTNNALIVPIVRMAQTQPRCTLYEEFNYSPFLRLFSPEHAVTIMLFSFARIPILNSTSLQPSVPRE